MVHLLPFAVKFVLIDEVAVCVRQLTPGTSVLRTRCVIKGQKKRLLPAHKIAPTTNFHFNMLAL